MPKEDPHPSPMRLAAFDLGRLPSAEWTTIAHHLADCAECCRQMENLPEDALLRSLKAAVLSSRTPPAPIPAELINHPRYRVLEFLGGGGMGMVFKATHVLMERMVALKVIRKELLSRPDLVERFRQEVKAAARLAHPNIVTAHDAEQVGDLHFLVMEYVEGTNLEQLVQAKGPLAVEHACSLVQQAARGLHHAFQRGITHRDVKPSNLLLTRDGQVKVLDFGLARLSDTAGGQTPQGTMIGTPDYVAPDQAQDAQQAGIQADIYSLGCVFYFLLTGRPPFPGATVLETLLAHQTQTPLSLAEQRADVSAEVSALVDRMLAKAPEDRPHTPAEVAEALDRFASSSLNATPSFFLPSPSLAQLPTCLPTPPVRISRRRRPLLIALTATLLLSGVVTLAVWPRPEGEERGDLSARGSAPVPTMPATERQRPPPRPLSHQELRAQALAWFTEHTSAKPNSKFMEATTAQIDIRSRRRVGYVYEVGSGLMGSRRTTLLLVRCGAFHVFELTNTQARNWPHGSGGVFTADFSDQDVLEPSPAIELSDPQIDNALQLDGDQQLTGNVHVRCLTAVPGPLMLRFASPAGGFMYTDHFSLPKGLSAGQTTCPFGFARLNSRADPRRLGPYIVCLEVCSLNKSGDKEIATVLSNSVATIVNVMPAPR